MSVRLVKKSERPQRKDAGFRRRCAAWVIDSSLLAGIAYGAMMLVGRIPSLPPAVVPLLTPLVMLAVLLLYRLGLPAEIGVTPGYRLAGLRLISAGGHAPAAAQIVVRALAEIASAACLGVGYLWMVYDEKKQTWHDKAAGTSVITVPVPWLEWFSGPIRYQLAIPMVLLGLLVIYGQNVLRSRPAERSERGGDELLEGLERNRRNGEDLREQLVRRFEEYSVAVGGCKEVECYRDLVAQNASRGRLEREDAMAGRTREAEFRLTRWMSEKAVPGSLQAVLVNDTDRSLGSVTVAVPPAPPAEETKTAEGKMNKDGPEPTRSDGASEEAHLVDVATYWVREGDRWTLDSGPFERPHRKP